MTKSYNEKTFIHSYFLIIYLYTLLITVITLFSNSKGKKLSGKFERGKP